METEHRCQSPIIAVTVVAGFCLAALAGCEPEVPQRDAPPERVEVIFDAEAEILPMPNDAAMEEGRLPGLSGAEEGTAAGELSDYMQQLTGWPRTIPVEIPFTGPLDEETLDDDSVRLYRVYDDEDSTDLVRAEVAALEYRELEDRTVVEIVPAEAPTAGDEYAGVVTRQLQGADGHAVGAPLAGYLSGARTPLVDEEGEPTMAALADQPETARQLEQMRQSLAPVYDELEEGGDEADQVSRDDTAMVFRWTTMPEIAAAFFPDFEEVPLPNTAALDEDGTFPDSALCHVGEESAEGVLDDYLAGLSGWPAETPITLTLTGAVDEDSIDEDDVQLWRRTDGDWSRDEAIEISYRETGVDQCSGEEFDTHVIDIEPGEPMSTHEEYFAFATGDIEPVAGEGPVVPEMPLLLALQPNELVDEEGASTVDALSDDQAGELEGLRQSLQPVLEAVEAETGLTYEDLAAVWSWYTWDDTFAVYDPAGGTVPFPNSALMEDGTVQIPVADDAVPIRASLIEAINERTGFSPTAPGWIPLNGELDEEASELSEGVRFLNSDALSVLDDSDIELDYEPAADRIVFEPTDPLPVGDGHVGVVSDDLKGVNGRPVQPSPFIALLLGGQPVAEDGESLVGMLEDEDAVELEESRTEFESQLPVLGPFAFDDWGHDDGTDRDNILAVWTFAPEDSVEPMREYRAQVRHAIQQQGDLELGRACEETGACGNDPDLVEPGAEIDHPDDSAVSVDTSHLRAIHTGAEFTTVDGQLEDGRAGLSVAIPETDAEGQDCEPPFDVVVAGHGFEADRRQGLLAVADRAAATGCLATAAPDFPGHGGRTDDDGDLHPATTPADSGDEFWTADFAASKANFVDALGDLFALVRILEAADEASSPVDVLFDEPAADEPLTGEVIGYAGIGLGGVVGVPFAAVDPSVQQLALHGAGGRLGWMIDGDDEGLSELGEAVADTIEAALDAAFDGAEARQMMAFGQWLLDRVDPLLFAEQAVDGGLQTLAYDDDDEGDGFGPVVGETCDDDGDCPAAWSCEEVEDADVCVEYTPETEPLAQMAEGDRMVVNRTTEVLADRLGTDLEETTFEDVPHAFIGVHDDTDAAFDAAWCARGQVGSWLFDASLPADLSAEECLQD